MARARPPRGRPLLLGVAAHSASSLFFTFACCATTTRGRGEKRGVIALISPASRETTALKSWTRRILVQPSFDSQMSRRVRRRAVASRESPRASDQRRENREPRCQFSPFQSPLKPPANNSPAPSRVVPLDCESRRVRPEGCCCKLRAVAAIHFFFGGGGATRQQFFLGFFSLSPPVFPVLCNTLHYRRRTSKWISCRIYRGREIIPSVE